MFRRATIARTDNPSSRSLQMYSHAARIFTHCGFAPHGRFVGAMCSICTSRRQNAREKLYAYMFFLKHRKRSWILTVGVGDYIRIGEGCAQLGRETSTFRVAIFMQN